MENDEEVRAEIAETVNEVEEHAEEQQAEDEETLWRAGLALELESLRRSQQTLSEQMSSMLERLNPTPAAPVSSPAEIANPAPEAAAEANEVREVTEAGAAQGPAPGGPAGGPEPSRRRIPLI